MIIDLSIALKKLMGAVMIYSGRDVDWKIYLYIIYTHGKSFHFQGFTGFLLLNRIILYTIFILQEKVSRIDRFVALPVGHNGNKCVTFI